MEEKAQTEGQIEPQIEMVSDPEWSAMQREAMGDDYPGDAEMQREREEFMRDFEAHNAAQAQEANREPEPAPAPAEQPTAKEWNAREWLNETFKNDPGFKDLSDEDMSRLEAMANEKHDEMTQEVQEWAQEKTAEWTQELKDGVREGLESVPELQDFVETRLADGELSEDDKAALKEVAEGITPQEAAGILHPITDAVHEIQGELIDGVEMIVDNAIEDIDEIVDARAEMPGGDAPEVQALQRQIDEAPEQVHDALDWEREQLDANYAKIDERLDLIEAGADPRDLPPDTDTYQVDENADQYETADA